MLRSLKTGYFACHVVKIFSDHVYISIFVVYYWVGHVVHAIRHTDGTIHNELRKRIVLTFYNGVWLTVYVFLV